MNQSAELNLNIINRVAMGDVLRRRSRSTPNQEALVEFIDGERRSINYAQLNQRANQCGHGLRAMGLRQGDRVALLSGNSIDFITVIFACYKTGIVVVPINFLQNTDDIRFNFEHSEAKALIYETELEGLSCQCAEGLRSVQHKVCIGASNGAADTSLNQLCEGQSDEEIFDIIIQDRDVAQVLYTSGTTSRPKGVETAHLSLMLATLNTAVSLGIPENSASLNVFPSFISPPSTPC